MKFLSNPVFKLAVVSSVSVATLFAFAGMASADTLAPASAPCHVVGTPFLTIQQNITNDPDSGNFGDWATDAFTENVKVWVGTDGVTYCANANTVNGTFTTNGTKSPQNGTQLAETVKGTFTGGENYLFPSTLILNLSYATNTPKTITLPDSSTAGFSWWVNELFPSVSTNQGSSYVQTYSLTYITPDNGTWTDADPTSLAGSDPGEIAHSSTVTVYSISQLNTELADSSVSTIKFGNDITTTAQVIINRAVIVDGQGHKLSATITNGTNSAITIGSNHVAIKNLVEDGTGSTGIHGFNIYKASNIVLDTVTSSNNNKSGITVNGSEVIANNITTSGNSWGGINVDLGSGVNGPAVLTVNGKSSHTESTAIWEDDITKNVSVVDTNHQYSFKNSGNTRVYTLLKSGETTPDNNGNAAVSDTNKNVVVSSSTQPIIVTAGGTNDATLDVGTLVAVVGNTKTGLIPSTTINSDTAKVEIPATRITSTDPNWNGTINLPKVITTTVAPIADSGNTASVINSVEVGYGDTHLTFNNPVKLTFAGQANSLIGWSQNGTFHAITATCDSATTPTLASDSECKIAVGSDLVVWTKHFTTFTTYTQSVTRAPANGGGGGGGSRHDISDLITPHAKGQVLGAFIGPEGSNIDSPVISAIKAQIIGLIKQLIAQLQVQLAAAIAAGH